MKNYVLVTTVILAILLITTITTITTLASSTNTRSNKNEFSNCIRSCVKQGQSNDSLCLKVFKNDSDQTKDNLKDCIKNITDKRDKRDHMISCSTNSSIIQKSNRVKKDSCMKNNELNEKTCKSSCSNLINNSNKNPSTTDPITTDNNTKNETDPGQGKICPMFIPICPDGKPASLPDENGCPNKVCPIQDPLPIDNNTIKKNVTSGICTLIYDPVCGDNNKTYPSPCELGNSGIPKACDGECPCKTQITKCDSLGKQISDEINNIQKCKTDSDCTFGGLDAPCNFYRCGTDYNKNANMDQLIYLSKQYSNNCRVMCPMYACFMPQNQTSKCIDGNCF